MQFEQVYAARTRVRYALIVRSSATLVLRFQRDTVTAIYIKPYVGGVVAVADRRATNPNGTFTDTECKIHQLGTHAFAFAAGTLQWLDESGTVSVCNAWEAFKSYFPGPEFKPDYLVAEKVPLILFGPFLEYFRKYPHDKPTEPAPCLWQIGTVFRDGIDTHLWRYYLEFDGTQARPRFKQCTIIGLVKCADFDPSKCGEMSEPPSETCDVNEALTFCSRLIAVTADNDCGVSPDYHAGILNDDGFSWIIGP